MSIKVMTMVFDRYPEGGNERLLALAMADHANDDGARIWPSVAELARKSLQSESTVRRQIKRMVARGWLEPVRSATGRPGDTNEYRINAEWIGGGKLPPMASETGVNLTPVSDAVEPEQLVDNCERNVDKVIHTGVKTGGTGVIAVTPESSCRTINTNTPPPPVGTGGCLKNTQERNPESGALGAKGKPPWRWHTTRSGIEREGRRLGLGGWDEAAFQGGRGEQFAAYEARVRRAFDAEVDGARQLAGRLAA